MDSSPPNLKSVLLMPRPSSPSPHQHSAPVTTTHFPPAPFPSYPWSNHSQNPDWNSKDETVDWYNYKQLLQQAKQQQERAEAARQQQEREELARQQQENYKQLLQQAKQQQEREEFARQQQEEREEFERFQKNINSAINKKITENQYEEIPDAPAHVFHNDKLHVRMPGDFKPLIEKPSGAHTTPSVKQSRQPLFNRAPGKERQTFHDIRLPPPTLGAASTVNKPPSDQLGGQHPSW